LIDKFNHDNNLHVADKTRADSMVEGIITAMPDAPAVISGGENVTKRRVTVNVRVTFQDLKLKKKVWEKNLSNWGDYEAGGSLSARQTAVASAIDKLTDDIVLETVSGW
jgi:hypothetical protein